MAYCGEQLTCFMLSQKFCITVLLIRKAFIWCAFWSNWSSIEEFFLYLVCNLFLRCRGSPPYHLATDVEEGQLAFQASYRPQISGNYHQHQLQTSNLRELPSTPCGDRLVGSAGDDHLADESPAVARLQACLLLLPQLSGVPKTTRYPNKKDQEMMYTCRNDFSCHHLYNTK